MVYMIGTLTGKAMVTLRLDILSIVDNCSGGAAPYHVEVTVSCDEVDLRPAGAPQAVLIPRHQQDHVVGWFLQVRAHAARRASVRKGRVMCEVVDGRVYTVRVCVTDAAGLKGCEEMTVGVALHSQKKGSVKYPICQGDIWEVAHDSALVHV